MIEQGTEFCQSCGSLIGQFEPICSMSKSRPQARRGFQPINSHEHGIKRTESREA
jgi:hypothetical protein